MGLRLALEVPERNAAFFWVGEAGDFMLGLWSLGSAPMSITLHVAFDVTVNDLLDAPKTLEAAGITPLSFFGVQTTEPDVIGWMPAASLFFHDPDGHLLEYLAMLDEDPSPDLRVGSWSEWLAHNET